MSVFVNVGIDGKETAAQAAEEIRARTSDAKPLLKNIGEHMLLSVDDHFKNEEGPSGEAWEPLAPATLKAKERDDILQERGRPSGLRGSITYEVLPSGVRVETPKVYGRVHQLGIGERSSVKTQQRMPAIPARPFLGVSSEDLEAIEGMITRFLSEDEA
jgi:phage virion morphogenesis protein